MSGTSEITKGGGGRRRLRLPRLRAILPAPRQHHMAARESAAAASKSALGVGPRLLPSLDTWTREILEAKMNRLYVPRQSWSFSRRCSRSFRDRDISGSIRQTTRKGRRIKRLNASMSGAAPPVSDSSVSPGVPAVDIAPDYRKRGRPRVSGQLGERAVMRHAPDYRFGGPSRFRSRG